MNYNIVFIGAGNLATHLSQALQKSGNNIIQVYSKTEANAKTLANKLDASYICNIDKINTDADLYIFALKDEVIPSILNQAILKNKLLIHTAGSLPIEIFNQYTNNFGCIYPLQTFSKNRDVDFSQIPIFIEGNNNNVTEILKEIALQLSNNVVEIDSISRAKLHLSAIFACNFANHLFTIAADILKSSNLNFDYLKPLIIETTQKILEIPPLQAQTGPAMRNDQNIMQKHLDLLADNKDYQNLYRFVSESIVNMHFNK